MYYELGMTFYRKFWMSWNDGFLVVGYGDPYNNVFMNVTDPYGLRDFVSLHLANWDQMYPVEWEFSRSTG